MTTDPKSASPRTDQFSSNIERQIQSGNTRYDEMVLFARHLERELADCKAELALERECREVGKAPCGHSEQYCYTADEGKHIACLLCEHESHLAAHTEREGVTVPANIFQGALNYIRHVGANWTERGEKHPQQWIVDGLELAAANQPAPSAASGLAEIRTTTGMMLPLERYNELLEAEQFRAAMLHKDVTRERPYVCRECGNWELVKRCTRRDQPWVSVNPQWRCHKFEDHAGACSTHMDCGERSSEGTICGYTPDHEGPHAWEALHSRQAPVGEGKLPMSERIPVCIPVTGLWLRQREGKAQVLFEWQSRWYFGIEETEGAPYSHILEVGGMASSKPDATSSPQTGGGS